MLYLIDTSVSFGSILILKCADNPGAIFPSFTCELLEISILSTVNFLSMPPVEISLSFTKIFHAPFLSIMSPSILLLNSANI